jgi:phage-related minor tail protein
VSTLGTLAVSIVGDPRNLEKTFDGVNKQIDNFSKKMQDTGKKISKVGKDLSLKVTAPIVAAGGMAFKLAADFEDALGATDQIFKSSAESMKSWANSLASYYGIAKGEALEYANMMGSMLVNIGGLTEEQAAKQAQTLIELAGDLTAMYGGTTADAVRALTGALKGNNTMLDNYGMAVNDAMVKTKALEMGLIGEGEQLTLAAKQAATLALIMEQTGAAQGQAAREADGASGTMRALGTEIKNLGAELGQVLIPIITPFLARIRDLISKFREMSPETQKLIVTIAGIAAAIGPVLVVIGNIITAIGVIAPIVAKIIAAIKVVGAVIGGVAAGPIALIVAAIAALIAIIILVIKYWDEIVAAFKAGWEWLKSVFQKWWEGFTEFWGGVWEKVKEVLLAAWEWIKDLFLQYHPIGLVITHWETIKEFFVNLWDRVKEIFSGAMEAIGNFITDKFNAVVGFLTGIRDKIIGVFQRVKDRVTEIWEGIVGSIKGAVNSVIAAINGMIGRINEISVTIPDWVPKFGGKTIGFNIPTIPYLAAGGDILRAGAAIVGERGPELLHLPQGAKVEPLTGGAREMKHSGTIRVEGVNDRGQLSAVVDIVIEQLLQEVRA